MGIDANADAGRGYSWKTIGQIAALAVVYFLLGKLGLRLGYNPNASAVWPPTGIALAAVLVLGYRIWPGIWIGAFLVNFTAEWAQTSGHGFIQVLGIIGCASSIAVGNTLESVLGGWLVNRFANGRDAFEKARSILRFIFLAAILSAAVSATFGATSLALATSLGLGNFVLWRHYGPVWLTWWLGDMVSAMLITPFVVIWSSAPRPRWNSRQLFEALLSLTAVVVVAMIVFGGLLPAPLVRYPLAFLCFPPLLWAAYRFQQHGAISTAFVLSGVALFGTLIEIGPFFVGDRNASLLILQAFIGTITVMNLMLGAVVSERRNADEALRAKESQLRLVADMTPVMLTQCDRDLRYQFINRACGEFLGVAPEQIAGKSIAEVLGAEAFETIRPHVEAVLQGQTVEYDAEIPYAHGGNHFMHVSYRPERDKRGEVLGWIASISDITERRRAEQTLRESEERFRNMAESAPVMIWMAGTDKLCTYFNKRWLEFTGRSMEQEIGNGWAEGIHPDDLQKCMDIYINSFNARRAFEMEYRLRRCDGEYRWISDHGLPRFVSPGEFVGYIGSCLDVTDRHRHEEAMRRAQAELEQRVAKRTVELRRRNEQLARLSSELTLTEERERRRLAQVLHDHLQQLLVAIKMGLEVVSHRSGEQQQKEVKRLHKLLDESITVSRSLTVELSPPILHDGGLAAGLEWLGRWMQDKHGLSVEVSVDERAAAVRDDVRYLVFQSVREALFNVVKHAKVTKARVVLEHFQDAHLRVIISDEGVGFDPSTMDRTDDGAAGLGLFCIRERLQLLSGRLEIQSQPQQGARIILIAPLHPPHSESSTVTGA